MIKMSSIGRNVRVWRTSNVKFGSGYGLVILNVRQITINIQVYMLK